MRVLITGGTGFIGSRLAEKCLARNDDVVVLGRQEATDAEARNSEQLQSRGVELVLGSLIDRDRMFEVTKGVDLVVHLAAAQHEMNIPDETFRAVNVEGTRNILDASISAGVQKFVHGSTIGVYKRDVVEVVDEDTAIMPDNIYGITKAEGEQLVRTYFDRLPCVIIRISETYGPGDRRLLKLFTAISKQMFFMIGKGDNTHQLIYVDDLIDGILLAAQSENAPGEHFVLAGKERLTSNEMVSAIARAVDVREREWHAPLWLFMLAATVMEKTMRPMGLQPPLHRRRMDFFTKSFQISTTKAQEKLGFTTKTSFEEGARRTAHWYKEYGFL